jgi:flagellar biosynthesis protein FliQ
MKLRFRAPVSVAIAIGVGVIVLVGYFFGADASGQPTILGILRDYFLQGAVVVAGVALLVGFFNLTSAHAKKIRQGDGAMYSVITVIALLLTLLVGTYDLVMTYWQGVPGLKWTRWLFENIQLPIETSLMAVLVVSLTFAATRILSQRLNFISGVFAVFVLVLLVTAIPAVAARLGVIADIRSWILAVPAVGGARGILLGVALGTVATGIRILMGADRPYGG